MRPFLKIEEKKKGKMIQRAELKTTEDYVQPLKSNGIYLVGFQILSFFLSIFLLLNGNVLTFILFLLHCCIFGADH